VTFRRGRLIAFLNAYWRPIKLDEYLHEMGLPEVWDAQTIAFSRLTEEQGNRIEDWIWEPERTPFECSPIVRRV